VAEVRQVTLLTIALTTQAIVLKQFLLLAPPSNPQQPSPLLKQRIQENERHRSPLSNEKIYKQVCLTLRYALLTRVAGTTTSTQNEQSHIWCLIFTFDSCTGGSPSSLRWSQQLLLWLLLCCDRCHPFQGLTQGRVDALHGLGVLRRGPPGKKEPPFFVVFGFSIYFWFR
jgi:hypothetical protein